MMSGKDRRRAAMRALGFGEGVAVLLARALGMAKQAVYLDLHGQIALRPDTGAAFGEQQVDFG